jgi:hypothetical protein
MGETPGSGRKIRWTKGTVAVMVAVGIPTIGIGAAAYYFYLRKHA